MLFLAMMDFITSESTDYVGAGICLNDHGCLADLDFVDDVALFM